MVFGKNKSEPEVEGQVAEDYEDLDNRGLKRRVRKMVKESEDINDDTKSRKKALDAESNPVLHTGENIVSGDNMEYEVIGDILEKAIKPNNWKEYFGMYWVYIVIFSIIVSVIGAAFWDTLTTRGTPSWVAGMALMLIPLFVMYFYVVEVRDRVDKKYPQWTDLNSGVVVNYMKKGEEKGYWLIVPIAVHHNKVFIPANPFGDGQYLVVAIDSKCINELAGGAGIVTAGRLYRDGTGRATFRVEQDPDYTPNPDIHKLTFNLSLLKVQLGAERDMRVEMQKKYDNLRRLLVEDEFEYMTKFLRRLVPVMGLMLRSKEQDLVTDVAITDAMARGGFDTEKMNDDEKRAIADAIRRTRG